MARLLVVDDEPSIRELLRMILETEGHEVTEAEDGVKALAEIEREMPDLVLLDLQMPRMDGWHLIDELYARGLRDRTRLVIVSGHAEVRPPRGVPAGRVLAKPFGVAALLDAVNTALAEEPRTLRRRGDRTRSLIHLLEQVETLLG